MPRFGAFFVEGDSGDSAYAILRDSSLPPDKAARAFVDELWESAHHSVDPRLPERARKALHPCFWELYLAATAVDCGMTLGPWSERRRRDSAPDLQIGKVDLWIEATTVGAGAGPDAVAEPPMGEFAAVPEERITLRIASALATKQAQYTRFLSDSVVGPQEPFVVAVNAAGVPGGSSPEDPPYAVRAVYPVGSEFIRWDAATRRVVAHSLHRRESIEKSSGSSVPTSAFLSEEYSGISALVFSCVNAFNPRRPLGFDFTVVHNAGARNPLPLGFIPFWLEYWVEAGKLQCRRQGEPR